VKIAQIVLFKKVFLQGLSHHLSLTGSGLVGQIIIQRKTADGFNFFCCVLNF
jgi:hypothetical protein